MKKLITTLIATLIASMSITALGCSGGTVTPPANSNSSSIEQSVNSSSEQNNQSGSSSQSGIVGPNQGATSSEPTPSNYLVTFKNGNEVLQSNSLQVGTQIVYEGATPTKQATEEFTYSFDGWATSEGGEVVELGLVQGEVTYYAVFTETKVQYEITFDVEGVKTTVNVNYGEVPVYEGIPTKEATAEYTYSFIGWDVGGFVFTELPEVTQAQTYVAKFKETKNSYSIKFIANGTEVQSNTLEYGATIEYAGETPTKETTAEHTYSFAGWATSEGGEVIELGSVQGEATYYAVFTEVDREYSVFWNVEGTETPSSVVYGNAPTYAGTPEKASTDVYSYTFVGWSKTQGGEVVDLLSETITGETTYYAVFSETQIRFTITWNIDGKTSTSYGYKDKAPSYTGETPTKSAVGKIYTFAGWSTSSNGEVVNLNEQVITKDETYYAVFTEETQTFSVTWYVDGKATVETYEYGASLSYPNGEPTKENNGDIYYLFDGWSQTSGGAKVDISSIKVYDNHTFYAVFKEVAQTFTITINYVYKDGSQAHASKTLTREKGTVYGETDTLSPTITGYAPDRYWFAGILTEDTTYTVTYSEVTVWDGASVATSFESGTGTKADPYIIKTGAQLKYLSSLGEAATTAKGDLYGTGIYYKLGASIDLSAAAWTPICARDSLTSYDWTYFDGNFDGDGHTIIIKIDTTNMGYGLFQGLGSSSVVTNLTITGSAKAAHRVGALAYITLAGSQITDCYNYADVTSTGTAGYTGGFLGSSASVMLNCYNYGDIVGSTFNGGIAGNTGGANISNCYNYGAITGSASGTGGISGQAASTSTIQLSVNYGKVSGTTNVGGVTGYVGAGSKVLGSTNFADVTSTGADCGGIVGENQGHVTSVTVDSKTYYNYNYGKITGGANNVGGITGYNLKATALTSYSYNYGEVYGIGSYVGGIVGENSAGSVSYSENRGNVSGDVSYVAGVIGRNNGGALASHLTNYGIVKANNYQSKTGTGIGGVIGSNQNSSPADNLTNHGDVYGYTQVGGISGYQGAGSTITTCSNSGKIYGYGTVGQTVGTIMET